jgi:hypothetical protein
MEYKRQPTNGLIHGTGEVERMSWKSQNGGQDMESSEVELHAGAIPNIFHSESSCHIKSGWQTKSADERRN